jgi:hypothetical protein
MRKLLLPVAVVALLVCACTNSKETGTKPPKIAEITQTTGPDASDLLKTLQGHWQNTEEQGYEIEILDTQMRHIRNGQTTAETQIVMDGACSLQKCAIDSTLLIDGWCFIEKGANGEQCNIVITCDKSTLKYAPINTPNVALMFKKL